MRDCINIQLKTDEIWIRIDEDAEEEKEDGEDSASIPSLMEGQQLPAVKGSVTEHWTQPPKAYTEDSLLAAMERAGNADMDDDVERKGLGTPATRAGEIETIIRRGYVERNGKALVPTSAGLSVYEIVKGKSIADVELTARWENSLSQLAAGNSWRRLSKN